MLAAPSRPKSLTPGATVHFRAVAQSDFVALDGADQSFVDQNTPPVVSIDNPPDKVKIKTLGEGGMLSVQLTVSEPATVTVEILNKKEKVVRAVVLDRPTAGSFVARISLTHLRGKLTPRVTATDLDGASTVVEGFFGVVDEYVKFPPPLAA